MGDIIFWAIIRTAIAIPAVWYLLSLFDYKYWILWAALALYGVVLHPAYLKYIKFAEKNKPVIEDTLCSSCKHFDESAVLCMKYDKHPTTEYIPCEGNDWEIS